MCRVGVLQRCGARAIHTTGVSLGCLSQKGGMRAVPTSRNEGLGGTSQGLAQGVYAPSRGGPGPAMLPSSGLAQPTH